MKYILLLSLVSALIAGCGSSVTPEASRTSATRSAGAVKTGMTVKEVEAALGGPGSPDSANPSALHYPTADGDILVTFTNAFRRSPPPRATANRCRSR